jgi:hypothetical protein
VLSSAQVISEINIYRGILIAAISFLRADNAIRCFIRTYLNGGFDYVVFIAEIAVYFRNQFFIPVAGNGIGRFYMGGKYQHICGNRPQVEVINRCYLWKIVF